jgi:hypothetical protein
MRLRIIFIKYIVNDEKKIKKALDFNDTHVPFSMAVCLVEKFTFLF